MKKDSKENIKTNRLCVYDGTTCSVTFQMAILKFTEEMDVHISLDETLDAEIWQTAIWYNITDEISWKAVEGLVWSEPITVLARRIMLTSKDEFNGTLGKVTIKTTTSEMVQYI